MMRGVVQQVGRTCGFAGVEPKENEDDTADQEEQTHEIELANMLRPGPSMVRVQVQEEE